MGVKGGAGARRQSQVRREGKTASFLDGRGPGPRASGLVSISSSVLTAMQEMSEAGSPTRGTRGPCPLPFTRARRIPTQTRWKLAWTYLVYAWSRQGPPGPDSPLWTFLSSALASPASLLPASQSTLLDAFGRP